MTDQYKTFTDERNGRSYYYITIKGKNKAGNADSVTVMAENLNIGEMYYYDEDLSDDTKIERYCYNDDTTNCEIYGGLYQWAEMMQLPSRCNTESCADLIQENHQGICPDGWRLLTQDDFYIVLRADEDFGIKAVRSSVFGGVNTTGYSLIGAGRIWNKKSMGITESTSWFYSEEDPDNPGEKALITGTSRSSTYMSPQYTYKTQGFSVRCVMVEKQTD